MNKSINVRLVISFVFLALFICISISNFSFAKDRWKSVGLNYWDTESAVSTGDGAIRFFYISPLMDAQRDYMKKQTTWTEAEVSQISVVRYGVILKCGRKSFGYFNITNLNEKSVPVGWITSIKPSEIEFNYIEPETNMEGLAKDVCKYFKLRY